MRFYVIANEAGETVSVGSVVASDEALAAQGLRVVDAFEVETDGTKIAISQVEELARRLSREVIAAYNRLSAVERRISALEAGPAIGGSYRENP